jgi:hypothetical protein
VSFMDPLSHVIFGPRQTSEDAQARVFRRGDLEPRPEHRASVKREMRKREESSLSTPFAGA